MKTHEDQNPEPGLPVNLVARMHRLAETETAGSRPFPRLDTAIRRDRVTRFGTIALAGAVAAAVIAVEVISGSALHTSQQGVPAAPTTSDVAVTASATPTVTATSPEQAGYGQTAGSLADDTTWLANFTDQVLKNAKDAEPDMTVTADDIHVVAAGDIATRARYAVVLVGYRSSDDTTWSRGVWSGAAGAAADAMKPALTTDFTDGSVPTDPDGFFFVQDADDPDANDPSKAVAIIVAPGAQDVQIVSSRRYLPNGTTQDQTRQLTATGTAVWTAALSADEYQISEYTADGQGTGYATTASAPDLSSVAAAGTDSTLLTGLDTAWGDNCPGLSTELEPAFASARLVSDPSGDLAAGILRSPDNGYLVALSAVHHDGKNTTTSWHTCALTDQNYADSDDVMLAAVATGYTGKALGQGHRLLVLAPAGAVKVRAEGVTSTVKDRLAVIDVQTSDKKAPTVEALDANGAVIATVTAIAGLTPLTVTN